MSDFKTRLIDEKEQLGAKIEKLAPFVASDNFKTIDPRQQSLLLVQLPVMQSYLKVLEERLAILD